MVPSSSYQVRRPVLREFKQLAQDRTGLHSLNMYMAKFTLAENHFLRLWTSGSKDASCMINLWTRQIRKGIWALVFWLPRPGSLSYFSNRRQNERTSKHYGYSSTSHPCSVWGSSLGPASLDTFIFWVYPQSVVQSHHICSALLKSHIGLETQNAHTSFGESTGTCVYCFSNDSNSGYDANEM